MRLRKPAGKARAEFFLQRQEGVGWSTLDTWSTTSDPDSNIFRGNPRTLRGLDPGDYKVFVLIGDEKRAEGFITILPAPAPAKPTSTPPAATPKAKSPVAPTPIVEAATAAAIPATTQAMPTPTPSGPRTEFGSGTWRVGVDIAPGTYRNEASDRCYWARLSGFSGSGEIIANDNTVGPSVVAISPTDTGFESKRCGTWVRAETVVPPQPATRMGDGVWRIGIDIAAGLYRNEGSDRCYWARLSGFGGSGEIIANDNTVGPSVVAISPTDAGFESKRCGTWVMQETP